MTRGGGWGWKSRSQSAVLPFDFSWNSAVRAILKIANIATLCQELRSLQVLVEINRQTIYLYNINYYILIE